MPEKGVTHVSEHVLPMSPVYTTVGERVGVRGTFGAMLMTGAAAFSHILICTSRRQRNKTGFQCTGRFHARVGETCLRFCRIEKPKAGKIASIKPSIPSQQSFSLQ